MQMRAPAERTKLGPWGKGVESFLADKSKEGGAVKRTLPLPHPQPALRRKSNRAERLGSGIPSLQFRGPQPPKKQTAYSKDKFKARLAIRKQILRGQSLQKEFVHT